MNIIKCKKCGYELFPSDTVCDRCGTPVDTGSNMTDEISNTPKKKAIRPEKINHVQQNTRPVTPQPAPMPQQQTNTTTDGFVVRKRPENTQNNFNYQNGNRTQNIEQPQKKHFIKELDTNSKLGVTALALCFFCCIPVGLVLAIIDLCKQDGKKKTCSIMALVISSISLIFAGANAIQKLAQNAVNNVPEYNITENDFSTDDYSYTDDTYDEQDFSDLYTEEPVEEYIESEPEPGPEPEESYNINYASDQSNMHIGDIARSDDFAVALLQVKNADCVKAVFNTEQEIDSNHEVVFCLFEAFNVSNKEKYLKRDDFICYCDSVQVRKQETNFLFIEDGMQEYSSGNIDAGLGAYPVVDFEVPRGWNELKIYYKSDCIWNVTNSEVTQDILTRNPIIGITPSFEVTSPGDTIYSGDYQIIYDGIQPYEEEILKYTKKYVIYKFTINNTSDTVIEYSNAGHSMRAYQDGHIIVEGADYVLDDNIDGYINIFDIDKIQAGMTAKIYVAFETDQIYGNQYMIYDAGFIIDNELADVFVNSIDG